MNRQLFRFTLFELIIVVALVFIVGVIVIPSYRGYALNSELVVARDVVIQALNQAQNRARSGEGDSSWGVYLETGRIIIFKGDSFSSFNPITDTNFKMPARIFVLGEINIVFEKLTGLPDWSGAVVLNNTDGQSVSLNINEQGVVSY